MHARTYTHTHTQTHTCVALAGQWCQPEWCAHTHALALAGQWCQPEWCAHTHAFALAGQRCLSEWCKYTHIHTRRHTHTLLSLQAIDASQNGANIYMNTRTHAHTHTLPSLQASGASRNGARGAVGISGGAARRSSRSSPAPPPGGVQVWSGASSSFVCVCVWLCGASRSSPASSWWRRGVVYRCAAAQPLLLVFYRCGVQVWSRASSF